LLLEDCDSDETPDNIFDKASSGKLAPKSRSATLMTGPG
jgi:hypothetical protein